ncbi:phage tail tape measure protein [Eubacterium sp.]|jgi:TP901 family phage tail tape measure protein|uniref:phage tail tape measure protein n=1 Tax=Eubacterium TaxID=1730 RepID=UPI00206B61BE|nr:MAG TPA: minor tail protein [Caudoviricetes sp.]
MANKNEAKVKFTADTKEFTEEINKSGQEISKLRSELRLNATQMKNNGTSVEGLAKKKKLLTKELEAQRNKTQALEAKLKSAKEIYGENSTEVTKLTTQLNNSKKAEMNLEKELSNTNKELKEQQKRMGLTAEQSEKLKDGFDKVGNASGAVAAGVVGVVGATVKMASEYEDSLAKVDTLADGAMTNYNGKAKSMKDAITELSNETGKGVNDIAEAVYQAMSAGQDASNAVAFVADNLKLAKGGFTEVEKATDIVTTVLNAYNLKSEESTRVSDILIQTQNKGKTTVDQLASSMGNVIPIAKAQNVNLENVAASYALMTANGVNTAKTTTNLKSLIEEMSDSGKTSAQVLKKETGSSFKELMDKGYSLGDCLNVLQEYAKKNDKEFGELFNKSNARSGALVLMKNGADGFNDSLKNMQSSSGSTKSAVDKLQTSSTKMNKSLTKIKNVGLEVGGIFLEELSPYIDDFGKKAEDFSKYAIENADKIVAEIKTVGTVAGTVFAINKVAQFGRSVKDITKGISVCTTTVKGLMAARQAEAVATEAETVAQTGLLAVLQANPIILFTTAIAGLAVGIGYLATRTKELPKEAKEAQSAYTELRNSIKENGETVQSQFGLYENYANKLDKIVDKDGKIKKGKENQAKVIVGALSEALGIELKIVNGQIKGYGKLRENIKQTIAQKKAEAILDANKDTYVKQLQEQNKWKEKITETTGKLNEQDKKVWESNKKLAGLNGQLAVEQSKRPSDRSQVTINQLQEEIHKTKSVLAVQKDQRDSIQKTLDKQKQYYNESKTFTQNYENLQEAAVSKDKEARKRATIALVNNYKTSTTASKIELIKQYNSAAANYDKTLRLYKSGKVSKAVLNDAKRAKDFAESELESINFAGISNKWVRQLKKPFQASWTGVGNKISKEIRKGFYDSFGVNPLKVPIKYKGSLPSAKGLIPANAVGGIYKQGTFLTTFAEESAEAAIPINNEPRSKQLWIQTGKMLGMVNENIGQRAVNVAIDSSETNSLLRALLKKDSNLYVDGNKLVGATVGHRDRYDGIGFELEERGISY